MSEIGDWANKATTPCVSLDVDKLVLPPFFFLVSSCNSNPCSYDLNLRRLFLCELQFGSHNVPRLGERCMNQETSPKNIV